MNAFDFDGTIYEGDSSTDFVIYCLMRHPSSLRRIPSIAWAALRHYALRSIDKTTMKATFFSFLHDLPNLSELIVAFWNARMDKIMPWYHEVARPDDIIISASPEFLLEEACARLGVGTLIGSEVQQNTGAFLSPNCHDVEKVRRLNALMPNAVIENFYSDSLSDQPMADIARHAWIIKKGVPTPWPRSSFSRV